MIEYVVGDATQPILAVLREFTIEPEVAEDVCAWLGESEKKETTT